MATTKSVPANSLDAAISYVRNGGRLVVRTALRVTVIDRKCLHRFEKADAWLLKVDGNGYRLRAGKGSVYLLPGQLEYVIE
jgi:hypothetical protein